MLQDDPESHMEESAVPIETALGVIAGRDAIFLDTVEYGIGGDTLVLCGEFNSTLCSASPEQDSWIKYRLAFDAVVFLQIVELDIDPRALKHESSFDRIENSSLIDSFRPRDFDKMVTPNHHHYSVCTYDNVFEIVAAKYELTIGDMRTKTR